YIVIPDGPKGRSGIQLATHARMARWVPALASLGRDDKFVCYCTDLRGAPRTPSASAATRSVTAFTVFLVALFCLSRLCFSASTSAEPTTTPSAPLAMARACVAVLTPKPTATGSLVWRLMRAIAAVTLEVSGAAMPV